MAVGLEYTVTAGCLERRFIVIRPFVVSGVVGVSQKLGLSGSVLASTRQGCLAAP